MAQDSTRLRRERRAWEENNEIDRVDPRFDTRGRQTTMCEGCGRRHAIVGPCIPTNGLS
jgi:hypothetical protein